jgi:hypothetical protein
MPTIHWVITAVITTATPLLPSPIDTDGWGLRIHRFHAPAPFLQCESFNGVACDIVLLNYSKEAREHERLAVAQQIGDLDLVITGPNGKVLPGYGHSFAREPFTELGKLRAGEWESERFWVGVFGYHMLSDTGRYRMVATLKTKGKTIASPPVEFEVVKVLDDAVLVSCLLPLEGAQLRRPVELRHRAVVQQVRVGDSNWLVYRRFTGGLKGGVYFTRRIAELPGKVEMTVQGAYGDRNPLTIRYKDANSKTGWRTQVINSVNGLPWTEEEERLRIERNKKRGDSPQTPVKP